MTSTRQTARPDSERLKRESGWLECCHKVASQVKKLPLSALQAIQILQLGAAGVAIDRNHQR